MISIKDLNFKYHNKIIFEDFNLTINNNRIVSIIGPNGCGKTTLAKILVGLLEFEGTIKINKKELNKENINEIRKNVGVVFSNPDNQFVAETVMDDIAFTLENMNYSKEKIKEKIEQISNYLEITDILECNPSELNINQKQLVCLACALVHEPKTLILDEALIRLDPLVKDKFKNILLELKKEMIIINITHDIEDTLISDEVILMDKGKVLLKGDKEELYKQENLLTDLGFKLPFMVELSNRLKFYDLIDETIYDMRDMVNQLWK